MSMIKWLLMVMLVIWIILKASLKTHKLVEPGFDRSI